MLKFPIPPEYCLIINAFSQATTLRGAAALLGMDPPALVRKVQRISAEYGYLQKVGSRWAMTDSGRRVAHWTDELIQSQMKLTQERSQLRIAAFSWLAEEMLIPQFHQLNQLMEKEQAWAIKITASNLEQELIQSRSDFVIHGHAPSDPMIAYKKISNYSWVVVAPYSWKKQFMGLTEEETLTSLKKKKFIRYLGMNSEEVLGFSPQTFSELSVNGVIGLRAAVGSGLGWSLLPAMSIQSALKEKKIFQLNLKTQIKDEVSVWWLRSRKDVSASSKVLIKWISEFEVDAI